MKLVYPDFTKNLAYKIISMILSINRRYSQLHTKLFPCQFSKIFGTRTIYNLAANCQKDKRNVDFEDLEHEVEKGK